MKKFLSNFFAALWVYPLRLVLIFLTYLLYRPKVYYEGKDSPHRRVKSPTVLTCNHLRGCDGAVISVIFYRSRIHSLAARRWYQKWYLKPLLVCGYSIPIGRASASWLRESVHSLQAGDSVLIFPEGMAVPGTEIRPFKPGFLLLARASGAPVLPLYMEGCYNRPFLKRLRIVVGTPYYPNLSPEGEPMTRAHYEAECRILFEKTVALRALLHEKRKGRKDKKHEKT
jgi:1-acyl-sn-glycerol-3-phosphate acyltransferase